MTELEITGLTEKSNAIQEKYNPNDKWWRETNFRNMITRDHKGYFTEGEIQLIEWYGRKWFRDLSRKA